MNITFGNSIGYSYATLQATIQAKSATGTDKIGADFSVSVTSVTATEEPAERSVDDVKKEFSDYLDSLQISPGLSNAAISVNISEAAFEKMLADPGYMRKMEDLCKRDLCDPAWGNPITPSAIVVTIDADVPEEYLGTSYNHPDLRGKANSDGFWTRRTDKKTEKKEREERARDKRAMLEFLQERADARKRMSREMFANPLGGKMPETISLSPFAEIGGGGGFSSVL